MDWWWSPSGYESRTFNWKRECLWFLRINLKRKYKSTLLRSRILRLKSDLRFSNDHQKHSETVCSRWITGLKLFLTNALLLRYLISNAESLRLDQLWAWGFQIKSSKEQRTQVKLPKTCQWNFLELLEKSQWSWKRIRRKEFSISIQETKKRLLTIVAIVDHLILSLNERLNISASSLSKKLLVKRANLLYSNIN